MRGAFGLLLGLLSLVPSPAQAVSPWAHLADPIFVRVDPRGLPEEAVMSMAQDRAGFLWIGTQGGLARFDGYEFRTYLPDPSDPNALPDGFVHTLLADPSGGLWIGTINNGLVHFDGANERFRTWQPDPAAHTGPRSAEVDALALDRDGGLWVGGDGGLDRFDVEHERFERFDLGTGPQAAVWSLLVDRNHTMWAGTQRGLYYRPAGARAFTRFDLGANPPVILSLYEDRRGHLWAGSASALFDIDPARSHASALRSSPQDLATLAPGQQWAITEPSPGVIWAGTDSALSIVDPQSHAVRRALADTQNPGGLNSGRIVQFLRERSGLILVADHIGGLLLYNPASSGMYVLSSTRTDIGPAGPGGALAVAAEPDGRLWAGGLGGALVELDAMRGRTRAMTLPNRAAVQKLYLARDGTLWIGTTGGLCSLQHGATAARCPAGPREASSESVYAIAGSAARIWVGGSDGLVGFDPATGAVRAYGQGRSQHSLSNNQVRDLYLDRKGRLWIGTENGLDRLDPNGRITRYLFDPHNANTIGAGGMTTILEDSRGRIWAGANGGPLNVIDEQPDGSAHIRHIGLADGMPHENVDGLAQDGRGRIWASTDKGLALIDPITLKARGFGLADGVSDGGYWSGTVSKGADGTMFFGGLNGITIVAPGAASPWTYAPPVVVSALSIDRATVSIGTLEGREPSIDVPANNRDLSLEFAALDYAEPQALRYQYRLDGYDRDWVSVDAQHRSATFTHLPPGTFALEVRAANRLGAWTSPGLRLRVRVAPAWYETWWFRIAVLAAVLLGAFGFHRLRTAVLRRQQRELEALVDARTAELSQTNEKLQELSLSDPLTGLRNRRFISQNLPADAALAQRRYEHWRAQPAGDPPYDADLLFFLIDLDNFKTVNDQFGHQAGDLMLVQMRERLEQVFRESDVIARWGGDEFLAIARGSSRKDAHDIAERIREAMSARPFWLGNGQLYAETASIGFAALPFIPAAPNAVSWSQVIALADQALYMAKHSGRNTWYGLEAGDAADPERLVQQLGVSIEDAARNGALRVVSREGAATP